MQVNERVESSRSQLQPLDSVTIARLVSVLEGVMGEPLSPIEGEAQNAFAGEHWDELKMICLKDPCNPYLAALSCIGSAFRSPVIAESALRDASRHAAEVAKRNAETGIAVSFAEILGGQVN